MQNTAQTLNEIVSIYNDGADFYNKGADQVDNEALSALFKTMARLRQEAASDLEPFIDGRGKDITDSGTWAGQMRRGYASMMDMIQDSDHAYISQLEEHEDRTLEALKETLKEETLTPNVRRVLQEQLALFQQTHEKLRTLKKKLH